MTSVEVKREHIDKGEPRACDHCAVSKALLDIVKPDVFVATSASSVMLRTDAMTRMIRLPIAAMEFIDDYDECDTDEKKAGMQPISFGLDIPKEFLRANDEQATG